MTDDPDEPDIVVDDKYSTIEQLNEHLPDGVVFEGENRTLVVHGQEYDVKHIYSEIKSQAKDSGPATYAMTMGGVTIGLFLVGPWAGAAAATVGSIIGALYDKGYIDFTEQGLKLNMGDETEYIEPDEEAELTNPLEIHEDKWYEPDSDIYEIAIYLPEGDRRYYKTKEGAANRLIHEYGG